MIRIWWLVAIVLLIGVGFLIRTIFKPMALQNILRRTPIHMAVINNDLEAVRKCITTGADLTAQDVFGRTPLHLAKSREVADYLIAHGAPIDAQDVYGITANPFAADKTPPDIITCCFPNNLPAANATYTVYSGCDENKIRAAWRKEIIPYLVLHGADLDEPVYGDSMPLEHMVLFEEFDLAEELIRAGATINRSDKTVLNAIAGSRRPLRGIKFLLAHGADITARDNDGSSVLIQVIKEPIVDLIGFITFDPVFAETREKISALTYLIKKGAPVTSADRYGKTALHYAAFQNFPHMVKILVKHGADVTIKDSAGKTPLDVARERGNFEIVGYLQSLKN